jgi:hypothetical protein
MKNFTYKNWLVMVTHYPSLTYATASNLDTDESFQMKYILCSPAIIKEDMKNEIDERMGVTA